ncbi:thioesterase II family protein [Microbispora sp. KK1-11]|uniref:thioesterase II family protein n=1 Tax=Microbispora sp. KK1-11 TaxID=2053005 RepID=UPI001C8D1ACF|nr:alpha/beta fold hydrolase [Microbispora sp. KK1-11]
MTIVQAYPKGPEPAPPAWLSSDAGRQDAPARLFCFAHAGGGAGFFRPWRPLLLPEVEVCPVVLPGREWRLRERPYTRMEELVPAVVDGLLPYLDRPYALMGHSMGSAVAYEVARRLSAGPATPPAGLVVSGRRAPHLPKRRADLHGLPDEEFVAAVARLNGIPDQVLRQPDLLRLFVPGMRADFTLNETYRPLPGPPLSCPVSGLTGDADPEVTPEEMLAWREVTTGPFTLRVFAGDHFYLKGVRPDFIDALRTDLRRLLSVTS